MVKFLQSNPVQVLLCVIVLLDAGIVIAQILLDLNSVKGLRVYFTNLVERRLRRISLYERFSRCKRLDIYALFEEENAIK